MQKTVIAAAIAAILGGLLAGCAGGEAARKAEYQRAATLPPLEVPPDLTTPETRAGMALPELPQAQPQTASAQAAAEVAGGGLRVLPQAKNIRVLRDGQMRWLLVQSAPEDLWARLRNFWQQQGLELKRDDPALGIMETQWAENRADIPQGFVRGLLSKVMPNIYSAATRDKFRLRMERGSDSGATEIVLSHYGVEEILRAEGSEAYDTVWQTRPSDPELVAEMLNRLVIFLGVPEEQAKPLVAEAKPVQPQARARLAQDAEGYPLVQVEEGFARAWRRVGIALDRIGVVVEDRDRSAGLYYVRVVDMIDDAGKSKKGFFSGLFSKEEDKLAGKKAQILLKAEGEVTRVWVRDAQGVRDPSPAGRELLIRLESELR